MINVGIIGLGWWGMEAHLPAMLGHKDVCVLAIQKRSLPEAQSIAKRYSIPYCYTDSTELLKLENLDAVIICSTPNRHYIEARCALEAGLHVLLEKPMTFTYREAEELVNLAKIKKVQFLISCPWHYTAHAIDARKKIKDQSLGELQILSLWMTNYTLGFYNSKPWHEKFLLDKTSLEYKAPIIEPGVSSYSDLSVAGGGNIYCQLSHVFAYIGFLTGAEPVEIYADVNNLGSSVDIINTIQIRFSNNLLANISSAGIHAKLKRQFEIRLLGSDGLLELDLWNGTYAIDRIDGTSHKLPDLLPNEVYPQFQPAINLIECILNKEENGSSAVYGLYAMRLIEGAYASYKSKKPYIFT